MEPSIKLTWNECFNHLAIWGWHEIDWECFIINIQFPLSGALCWFLFMATHAISSWQLTRLTIQLFITSYWSVLFFNWSEFGCKESIYLCEPECVWMSESMQMKGLLKIFVWRGTSVLGEKWNMKKIAGIMTNSLFSYGLSVAFYMFLMNPWAWYAVSGIFSVSQLPPT